MDHISRCLSRPASPLLSQLTWGINETTIMVRVTSAWKSISYNSSDEMVANFVLLDEEDNQLLTVAHNKERDRVWPKLYEGLLYIITNFKIIASPTKWRPIASERSLLFYHETKIDTCCKAINISHLKFDLRLLSSIDYHPGTTTLVDVGGVVLEIHDLLDSFNGIQKLRLIIMDSSGVAFPIILWGRQASLFQVYFRLHRKVNTVLVITGLIVKNNLDHVHMASTPATIIHYNPEYRALKCLQHIVAKKYGQVICKVPIDTIHTQSTVQPPPRKLNELHELYNNQILEQKRIAIQKTVILDLLPISSWKMDSCACCSRDVILQDDTYHCNRCNKQYEPIIKRSMTIVVTDNNGTVLQFIIQPREIAQLIGMSPLQLVSTAANQKRIIVPTMKQIDSIKDTICDIEVQHYQTSPTDGNGEYVIKAITKSSKLVDNESSGNNYSCRNTKLKTQ